MKNVALTKQTLAQIGVIIVYGMVNEFSNYDITHILKAGYRGYRSHSLSLHRKDRSTFIAATSSAM
jgi:hypothetical protein